MSWNTWGQDFTKLLLMTILLGWDSLVLSSDNFNKIRVDWRRTNPIFNKTGGARLSVSVGSNLIIACPVNVSEYYRIYWVSEEEYTSCVRLQNKSHELFVNCHDPSSPIEFEQEILTFTPVPFGKDFVVGKNYYITTFSTGTKPGILNEYLGACDTWNMKLILTITEAPPLPTQAPSNGTKSTTQKPNTPTPRPTRSTTKSTTTTTLSTSTRRPTPSRTTSRPRSTDIPDPTDIVINVPDNGNTATIIANSAISLTQSWALILSLSILYLLNSVHTFLVTR